jgi:hypothetical protein
MNNNCLNCNEPIIGTFCHQCGQKATTHRFSIAHFFTHDLVHGFFHVDKGILFTIKCLFTNPGKHFKGYIEGKRMQYFNYITLLLLIIALIHFLGEFSSFKAADIMEGPSAKYMNEFEVFYKKNPKLVGLGFVPIYALFSFLFFRFTKLNFTEHLVLNAYKTAGEFILTIPLSVLFAFYHNMAVYKTLFLVMSAISFLYGIWFYYSFFSQYNKSKSQVLVRSIITPLAMQLVIGGIFMFISTIKK